METTGLLNLFKKHHHSIMMVLCFIPLVLVVISYFNGYKQSYLIWLFLLLCPLMHYWMMKEMHKPKLTEHGVEPRKESSAKGDSSCH